MAKISKDWQQCIADLLKRHGLGFRDARRKGEYLFSHTSVASWANEGLIPTYSADLARFLELISSREEACECLMAAGYPAPLDWPRIVLPVETLDEIMDRVDEETHHKLTPDEKDIIRRIIADELEQGGR